MTAKKKKEEVAVVVAEKTTFSKAQILKSNKYKDRKDLINVLLKDDEQYRISEVKDLIDEFMKRKVR